MKKSSAPGQIKTEIKIDKTPLTKKVRWPIIIFVLLVLITLPSYYFYNKYQKTQALLQNSNQAPATEAQVLVNNVGKLIELPANENPTIATVSDKTQLANQPFFAKAENGDKVLFYSNAKKVILYRPSSNKIIDVSLVNIGANSPVPTNFLSVSPSPKNPTIELYNGTKTIGLTAVAGKTIKAKLPDADIIDNDNASNQNYENTIVVDLSGTQSKYAQDLAAAVGGKVVSSLPSGEVKPNTDILVILGKDFVK